MNHTIPLPPRADIRARIGNVAEWARDHGHPPYAVHMTITRYAGTEVDLSRPWGSRTRRILSDLAALFAEAEAAA